MLSDTNRKPLSMRIILCRFFVALVIIAELCLLYFYRDGLISISTELTIRQYLDMHGGWQFWMATHIHRILRDIAYFLMLCLILYTANEYKKAYFWGSIIRNRIGSKTVVINLMSFGALLSMLIIVNNPRGIIASPYSLVTLAYISSPVLWVIYFWTVINLLFPLRILGEWLLNNRGLAFFIFMASALTTHQELIEEIVYFWSKLLLQPTLDVALAITPWMGLDVQVFPGGEHGPIFGSTRFVVEIWSSCSGYEGMALIIALLSVYCFLQRDILRIGNALLIIPFALIAMFFLNSIRIAILIAIGHFYSPKLALDGFHIVGGWLNLLLVFIACLIVLNSFDCFYKNPKIPNLFVNEDLPFLAPLAILMTIGLFSQIFVTNFDWFYPIPIFFCALCIIYFRRCFTPIIEKASFTAYIIGAIVFFLWVYLIPVDSNKSQDFFLEIDQSHLGIALLWIFCRVVGAVLIVPIAEELAFRGFALPYLEAWLGGLLNKNSLFKLSSYCIAFAGTLLSLILTSILFGVLHSDFLPGSLAGIGFGIAYLFRRKLIDAIVAHAVTNGLLSAYIIGFGYWSYW